MGLLRRLAQIREEHILGHARSCMAESDRVVCWVRARRPSDRKHGFAYVTRERLILCWTQGRDEQESVAWDEVATWEVRTAQPGGPVLSLTASDETVEAQMPVSTRGMVEAVSAFLAEVAARAADARAPAGATVAAPGKSAPPVNLERRSLAAYGRRFFVTLAGLLLILLGLVFASPVVPGPGMLTILAGLGLLASEYDWAKDAHHWGRKKLAKLTERFRRRRAARRNRRRRSVPIADREHGDA